MEGEGQRRKRGKAAKVTERRLWHWSSDADHVARRIRQTRSPLKLIVKTRNQFEHLKEWIDHHERIVGLGNLVILDNESTDDRVIRLLEEVSGDCVVCRFPGLHNRVHRAAEYPALHAAIREGSEYYGFFDSDERIHWAIDAERLAEPGALVSCLMAARPGPGSPVPGVWAENIWQSRSVFGLLRDEGKALIGLGTGKPIVSSAMQPPEMLCHNFQLEIGDPRDITCGNLLVLHLKNLFPRDRILANLEKIRQYRRIPAGLAHDEAVALVLDLLGRGALSGNPMKWAQEIQACLAMPDRSAQDRPAGGQILLRDAALQFHRDDFRAAYQDFLDNPGLHFAQALMQRHTKERNASPMNTVPKDLDAEDQATPTGQETGEITIPSRPSMSAEGYAVFRERLEASKVYLEYGSGGSTRQAAALGVPRIYSVESDRAFARAVRRAVSWNNRSELFRMRVPELGETKDWGYPAGYSHVTNWKHYVASTWSDMEANGDTPDLILVDGRFRVACFAYSFLQAAPGTCILFDDFVGREDRYAAVSGLVAPTRLHGRMAEFTVPAQDRRAREAALILFDHALDPR